MQLLLIAVSAAVSATVLGEAFVASAIGKRNARVSSVSSRTALLSTSKQGEHMRTTTMSAAIVGGGRIGCALYVSMTGGPCFIEISVAGLSAPVLGDNHSTYPVRCQDLHASHMHGRGR